MNDKEAAWVILGGFILSVICIWVKSWSKENQEGLAIVFCWVVTLFMAVCVVILFFGSIWTILT